MYRDMFAHYRHWTWFLSHAGPVVRYQSATWLTLWDFLWGRGTDGEANLWPVGNNLHRYVSKGVCLFEIHIQSRPRTLLVTKTWKINIFCENLGSHPIYIYMWFYIVVKEAISSFNYEEYLINTVITYEGLWFSLLLIYSSLIGYADKHPTLMHCTQWYRTPRFE